MAPIDLHNRAQLTASLRAWEAKRGRCRAAATRAKSAGAKAAAERDWREAHAMVLRRREQIAALDRPHGIDAVRARYPKYFAAPWTARARNNAGFKRMLLAAGYLSPHFALAEAACKDGTPIPARLIAGAQRHAFAMERLRHELGDRAIPITSWYRTPAHNAAVGGARGSMHIQAFACDIPVEFVRSVGTERFDRIAGSIFANGGFGQYPLGARHCDSRGWRARWTTWTT